MEILNSELYQRVLSRDLGYQSYERNQLRNSTTVRLEDGEGYVKIYKTHGIQVRLDQEMDWSK